MSDISATVQSVKLIAQQLTESSQVLVVPNPEYPVAQFAQGYTPDQAPTNTEVTPEMTASVEEHFGEMNDETVVTEEEVGADLISLVSGALAKIQYNVNNILCPSVDDMVRDFNERQQASTSADVRADIFRYNPIHSEPRLTTHLQNYANVNPQANYRTFILNPASAEEIIEMVSINNPHAEREQVTEWLLGVDPEVITGTYAALFGRNRSLAAGDLPFVVGTNAPFNVDALVLAYFICGHLSENPTDVIAESVTQEDWYHTMRMLHEMLGAYVLRAYTRRAEDQRNGVLILRSESSNAIENRRLVVHLNGDVEPQWKAQSGDLSAVLGSALETEGSQTIDRLKERQTYFIQKFQNVYPLIKQAAEDHAERSRRKDMIESFCTIAVQGTLGELQVPDLRERALQAIRGVRPEQLCNEFLAFSKLICEIYFPESTYWDYVCTMDRCNEELGGGVNNRELATQALLSLYAAWAAGQIRVERYKPEVVAAPEPLEEPTGGEAENAIEDAVTGEGPLVDDADESSEGDFVPGSDEADEEEV